MASTENSEGSFVGMRFFSAAVHWKIRSPKLLPATRREDRDRSLNLNQPASSRPGAIHPERRSAYDISFTCFHCAIYWITVATPTSIYLRSPPAVTYCSDQYQPLTKEKAAEILGVSKRTIENWVADGRMPAPHSAGGRRVYWHPDVFYRWLDARLHQDACSQAHPSPAPKDFGTPPAASKDLIQPPKRGRPRNALPPMLQHLQR